MIKVQINRTEDGKIESFTMKGHANYAEHGQDLVCAAASAVAFGSVNAVYALGVGEPIIEQSDGYLKCTIPDHLSEEAFEKVQLLLEGMIVSLQTIEREYDKYIRVTL